jgi:hypothetical protein
MYKKTMIAAAIFLLASLGAKAQFSIDFGDNLPIVTRTNPAGDKGDFSTGIGFLLGTSYHLNISRHLAVSAGVLYGWNYFKGEDAYVVSGSKIDSGHESHIMAPVNLELYLGRNRSVYFYAGPLFDYCIAAKGKLKDSGDRVDILADGTYRPFNLLLGGGIGFNLGLGVFCGAGVYKNTMNYTTVEDTSVDKYLVRIMFAFTL